MMKFHSLIVAVGILFPFILTPSHSLHVVAPVAVFQSRTSTRNAPPVIPSPIWPMKKQQSLSYHPSSARLSASHLWAEASTFALRSSSEGGEKDDNVNNTLRDQLRKVTGFSLTTFRSTWRAATGISLTAIYASALAASGLWIRKVMSVVLSIMPAWFRYFLQPFLVLYYAPLFILRGLTGPTRKRAKAKHEEILQSWKEAVAFAEKTHSEGYSPLHIDKNGDFEFVKPPKPNDATSRQQSADAVAESVEEAMEKGYGASSGERV